MQLFVKIVPDDDKKHYPSECTHCGWIGSSEQLHGGGQIADTGDYDDVYCPICGSRDLDDPDNDQPISNYVARLGKALQATKKWREKAESCDCERASPDSYREALDGSEPVLLVFDEKDILTHVGAVESIGQELVFDYAKRGFTILTVSINQYRKLGLTLYKSTCRAALGEKEVGG